MILNYFILALLAANPLSASAKNYFKQGPKLKKVVAFWEDVFSQHGEDKCVMHDGNDLKVIYDIFTIRGGARRTQEIYIERKKTEVENSLKMLATGKKPQSKYEKKIYASLPASLRAAKDVRKRLKSVRCQRGVADQFEKSLARSQKHLKMIRSELKKAQLPTELAFLPHLESGFHERAHSKAGARGLWQLMPEDARRAKLVVNSRRDDRLSPLKSTQAAVKILKRNFSKTDSWPLALTGYNYGINGIIRGIKKLRTADFWEFRTKHQSPIFGFAGKNFYPSFMAVVNLAKENESKTLDSKSSGKKT